MIGSYSALIKYQEALSMKKPVKRDLEMLRKNVVKCNRSKKLSYCKDGGK